LASILAARLMVAQSPIDQPQAPPTPVNTPAAHPAASPQPCDVTSASGPVSQPSTSIVDAVPYLLPLFNNAPVFGRPGTIQGNFWHRTQLIGDPDCKRSALTRRGIYIDMYATSAYENVVSGGLKTGYSFVQNTQLSLNIDTAKARLWPGGLIHLTIQSRYGSSPNNTFTAGAFAPEYAGLELPGPTFWQDTLPSDYSLVQGLSETLDLIVGKINGLFLADQTLFGDRFRYYFANSNFNKNAIYNNFFNTTTLAAVAAWNPRPWVTVAAGVHDPYTQPNTFAANAFNHGAVNLYAEGIFSYDVGGLPGQVLPAFNWSNQPKLNLQSPFQQLSPEQFPEAVNILVGNDSPSSLPANFKKGASFFISNFSQYLLIKEDDPSQVAEKVKNLEPVRGIGVFGRLGYAAPENLNPVNHQASVAMIAEGLSRRRQHDSFGLGFYYNGVSSELRESIRQFTGGTSISNENGAEVFYNFAVTPAINVNAGYQHIWNPLVASAIANQNHADLFVVRLNLVW
jgi:porin